MKTAEEFLQSNYPVLFDYFFDKDMPAGIDEVVCKAMEKYANQQVQLSSKNEVIEFLEKWISHFESEGIQNHFCIEAREIIRKLNNGK